MATAAPGGDGDAGGGGAAHDGEDGNGGAGSLKVDVPETMTEDLRLLHVIRITLIQRIYMLATHIPEFSLRYDLSPEELRTRILRLEIEEALETLCMIFPPGRHHRATEDFGEPATYESDTGQSYAREHGAHLRAHGQALRAVRRTSSGVNHIIGAMG